MCVRVCACMLFMVCWEHVLRVCATCMFFMVCWEHVALDVFLVAILDLVVCVLFVRQLVQRRHMAMPAPSSFVTFNAFSFGI